MCGRFALNPTEAELREHFSLRNGFVFKPKYNIAPTQLIPVVVFDNFDRPELVFMRWGFVPSWQKEPNGTGYMNARLETLSDKPTFKQAFIKQRCLIPASGFFEWQLIHQKKQPFFIYLKREPLFAMAGIWSKPTTPDAFPTCAILTQASQPETKMAEIHERMPVIVAPSGYATWLNIRAKLPNESTYLQTVDEKQIGCFPVSLQVNSVQFDNQNCLQPLS